LFVGVLSPVNGAAALRTPVLHVDTSASRSDAVVLHLGAWQGAWYGLSGGAATEATDRERIDRSEWRAAFCARGLLSDLGPR
jgi:hypothetical protein